MLAKVFVIFGLVLSLSPVAQAQDAQFYACDTRIRNGCNGLGLPAETIPMDPATQTLVLDPNYPNPRPGQVNGDTVAYIYQCLYSNASYNSNPYNWYAGIIGYCSYIMGATDQPLSLSLSPTIAVTPSAATADGNRSVTPNATTSFSVNVSGTGFKTPETRSANLSLQVDGVTVQSTIMSLAALKAAGGPLTVTLPYTFSTDDIGAKAIKVVLTKPDQSTVSASAKIYVLCNAETDSHKIQFFPQAQNPWGPELYGHGTNKIQKVGCQLSDIAMVFDFYGISTTVQGTAMDPESLNKGLKAMDNIAQVGPGLYTGFSQSSNDILPNGAVDFARNSYIDKCVAQTNDTLTCHADSFSKISYKGSPDTYTAEDRKIINSYICSGSPVILKVPSIHGSPQHFVLAKGFKVDANGTVGYNTNNPENSLGQNEFRDVNSAIWGYRAYINAADPSTIMFYLSGALDMVVTDPLGRRTGHNPQTGETFNEIPSANYIYAESIADPDDSGIQTEPTTKFEDLNAAEGSYKVQVFAKTATSYNLDSYKYDANGTINGAETKSGKLKANASVTMTIQHTSKAVPVQLGSLKTTSALVIDSKRKEKAFVAGKIQPVTGSSIPVVSKYLSVAVGDFTKTIEAKKLSKVRLFGRTHYVYADWSKNGFAIDLDITNGDFEIYVPNSDLDDASPAVQTNVRVVIDSFVAENLVTFKVVGKKPCGK